VLLQLKHKTLVRSLHCDDVNPYLQLEGSPFYIVQRPQSWDTFCDARGRAVPRRAGVSAFGGGGVNAHVVIEEYIPRAETARSLGIGPATGEAIVVLSARNEGQLRERVKELLSAIVERPLDDGDLADVAYTLQVGRDAMEALWSDCRVDR
jgi:polyketide synthase PksN